MIPNVRGYFSHDGASAQPSAMGGMRPWPPARYQPADTMPHATEEDAFLTETSAAATSLMISNIPCRVSQERVIEAVNRLGFEGAYDFVYIPTGCRTGPKRSLNMGYGFINFISPELASRFAQAFDGYRFEGSVGLRGCTCRPARAQGFRANVRFAAQSILRHGYRHGYGKPMLLI